MDLAIETVKEEIGMAGLPSKDAGYEAYDYIHDCETEEPWCYGIYLCTTKDGLKRPWIHIVIDEEKYMCYDEFTSDTPFITDKIQDIKMWLGKFTYDYNKFRY